MVERVIDGQTRDYGAGTATQSRLGGAWCPMGLSRGGGVEQGYRWDVKWGESGACNIWVKEFGGDDVRMGTWGACLAPRERDGPRAPERQTPRRPKRPSKVRRG